MRSQRRQHSVRVRIRLALAVLAVGTVTMLVPAPAQAGYDCGEACARAWQQQWATMLPRTEFYDAPVPLPANPAGTLIRAAATMEYQVDARATRLLYHTRTSTGRPVAASAIVLTPAAPPPAGGWPIVVNAHGSSGIGQPCAPSLMRDLYHGDQMMQFVGQGYAVVAPDYAGLGTDGRPEFLNKTAQANDVIDALTAARQAVPGLARDWVLWGHSQGGGAALAVAERLHDAPVPGYRGAVVTSPAADLTGVSYLKTQPGLAGFLALAVQGAAFSDPRISPQRLLTHAALERLSLTSTGCLNVVLAGYSDLSGDQTVRPAALDDRWFAGYLARNSVGNAPVAGPVLLLQGEADFVIPEGITATVTASLCAHQATVQYRTYPGLGHDTYPGVIGIDDGAMPDILTWLADRFAGNPAATTC